MDEHRCPSLYARPVDVGGGQQREATDRQDQKDRHPVADSSRHEYLPIVLQFLNRVDRQERA
jgi:hypothetical protein